MNNEPVAWIDPYDLERLPHHDCWVNGQEHKNSVPLYTHPAKTQEPDCYGDGNVYRGDRSKDSEIQTIHIDNTAKTLTDEEIKEAKREALKEYYSVLSYQAEFELSWIDELFARAILKKASEK